MKPQKNILCPDAINVIIDTLRHAADYDEFLTTYADVPDLDADVTAIRWLRDFIATELCVATEESTCIWNHLEKSSLVTFLTGHIQVMKILHVMKQSKLSLYEPTHHTRIAVIASQANLMSANDFLESVALLTRLWSALGMWLTVLETHQAASPRTCCLADVMSYFDPRRHWRAYRDAGFTGEFYSEAAAESCIQILQSDLIHSAYEVENATESTIDLLLLPGHRFTINAALAMAHIERTPLLEQPVETVSEIIDRTFRSVFALAHALEQLYIFRMDSPTGLGVWGSGEGQIPEG
ncbi:MAG: hypothetical protein ABIG66_01280 [Candidatus Kerfeldbacteria bacterium]